MDNNATTSVLDGVKDAVIAAMDAGIGNASSNHAAGDKGRTILRESRESVSELVGCVPEELVFLGSGTEANNLVLKSLSTDNSSRVHIVTTNTEHSSILKTCQVLEATKNVDVTYVPCSHDGRVSPEDIRSAIRPSTVLVSVHWVNNETGVIQPIEEIGEICTSKGIKFHVDAAQAVGKLKVDLSRLPIDFMTFTGHKFHAPAGTGVLYIKDSARTSDETFQLKAVIHGGAHERGFRAGTENLIGIAGLGEAARLRRNQLNEVIDDLTAIREAFEDAVIRAFPESRINGRMSYRICNTSNITFPVPNGEAFFTRLVSEGICCSQGSACVAARPEPSYVLTAMGLSEDEAYASIRFGFSVLNTHEEIPIVVNKLKNAESFISKFGLRETINL